MKGFIYCIKEISANKILYIGSTKNLNERISTHKYDCFTSLDNSPLYNYIRSKCDRNSFYNYFTFEILLEVEVKNRKELFIIEDKYINYYNTFNQIGSYFSNDDNKKSRQNYYIKNRDKLLAKQNEYNSNNKQKRKDYRVQYYIKNRDKIIDKAKANYKKRKQKNTIALF